MQKKHKRERIKNKKNIQKTNKKTNKKHHLDVKIANNINSGLWLGLGTGLVSFSQGRCSGEFPGGIPEECPSSDEVSLNSREWHYIAGDERRGRVTQSIREMRTKLPVGRTVPPPGGRAGRHVVVYSHDAASLGEMRRPHRQTQP